MSKIILMAKESIGQPYAISMEKTIEKVCLSLEETFLKRSHQRRRKPPKKGNKPMLREKQKAHQMDGEEKKIIILCKIFHTFFHMLENVRDHNQKQDQAIRFVFLSLPITLGVPSGQNRSALLFASYLRAFLLYWSVCSICIYSCCLFWYFVIIISNSTIAPRNIPPIRAFFAAIRGPALIARTPPVMAPEAILLNASSVFLKYMSVHYDIE